MNRQEIRNRFSRILNTLYEKLFKINDTPQRIALGLGLGVALGIIPGTGPLAALFLAVVFKVNRASALLGSLLTNTWLSFVTFLLALRIGSAIFRVSWIALKNDWKALFVGFRWSYLFKVSFFKVIMPILVGYILIALSLGIFVYLVSLIVIRKIRGGKKNETQRFY
ncbi:MAG: hypothetical protein COT38_03225 [Candidatus Omnitrophica bacterium CG08_land_8_20_14_0_20_41_16]|uniref:DUF2062 domain-containing protein n=1 Tax=Candidatus Sherwoodlollariibacterium unditelluris TaxID=1974757 RepID=A0A2G9YL01_9BACT|nr:MAG: hypothetical protein COX41_00695 [Candidatus Omnitrophica bacterium CG23_combo_of_CG06-09_8_20_14_all_41_10]PIS33838.1 MAG: hypothetical protein COT38_03225 [Candidatus Omnitrophica bacterium CG08_land_8_20_14_0_20_41_16]